MLFLQVLIPEPNLGFVDDLVGQHEVYTSIYIGGESKVLRIVPTVCQHMHKYEGAHVNVRVQSQFHACVLRGGGLRGRDAQQP